jgi:Domain of unknown function (DUF222)
MTAAVHSFEEPIVVDVFFPVTRPLPSAAESSRETAAARLQLLVRQRAIAAAEEAEFILRLADLSPAEDDLPPGHPGAKKESWRSEPEFPGVGEWFVPELAMVLNVGRGTAAFRARRAFCWRDKLPATFATLKHGDLDERRAQELFTVLEHAPTPLAHRIDAMLIGEAAELSVARLGERARALLLELDTAAADARRQEVQQGADVFLQPAGDGLTTIGADLPTDEAAEAYDLINQLALLAKQDGDERPIRQIRTEIYSLLLRQPGALTGVRANLTITAALESLEGSSSARGEVNGFVITPAQLQELLRRVGALGLHTPDDGSLTLAIVDGDGRLLATVGHRELEKRVRRGDGLGPPPAADAYEPTDAQRRFVTTRDRACRFPHCGQRVGWADHDHVVPHASGGGTDCTNLCCLCRTHHRLKTFARGWEFDLQPDGTLRVTTPSGITRVTRPPGLRPRSFGGGGHAGQPDPGPPQTSIEDELPPY